MTFTLSNRKVSGMTAKHTTQPLKFLTLTFIWSWGFLAPAILLGLDVEDFPVGVLRALSGIGPMAAAMILLYRNKDRELIQDYWARLTQPGRIGIGWLAVIFCTPLLLTGLSAGMDVLLGGKGLALEGAQALIEQPLSIIPYLLFILVFGPLPEEVGWRGYALDGLKDRFGFLSASLILGAVWGLWHLPLFFVEGTYQYGLGVGSNLFWMYMFTILFQSVVMTWIYYNTSRSTLSAVLFHFMVNLTGELFDLSYRSDLILVVLWGLVGVAIGAVLWTKSNELSR
jgi:membrane protease YdiL (CAAX protease family)